MASRKALVVVNGEIQQLQSGDTLSGATTTQTVIQQTNDESTSIVIGAPVYNDAADGVKKGLANAAGTSKIVGLVNDTSITNAVAGGICLAGILAATTTQWDTVAGTSGGLAFGTKYYLDPSTAGKITATAPSTVGQYVCELGIALSTTELMINIKPRILL